MIIRSQDKKIIVNLNNIDTIDIADLQVRCFNGVFDTAVVIGTYSTEEKAIKVLDMIQDKYAEYAKVASAFGEDIRGLYVLPRVFQMPQDEEVEV